MVLLPPLNVLWGVFFSACFGRGVSLVSLPPLNVLPPPQAGRLFTYIENYRCALTVMKVMSLLGSSVLVSQYVC